MEKLIKKFHNRNTFLNKSINNIYASHIENIFSYSVSNKLLKIYNIFDGFEIGEYDKKSQIRIWSSEDIVLSRKNLLEYTLIKNTFPVADLLINSKFF